ncbi:sensor domain-containing protein [Nocardiopsis sp. NPDC055551]|uniref:sensor domain-containing protein n=1 Tax=Nocardiopsis sp. NPDC006832 TaxID=3157188 RepID=UPI0033C8BAC6
MRTPPFVRMVRNTRYLLLGLPLAVVSFSLVLTGLVAGAGTSVLFVGLFLLSGTLLLARGPAHLERLRLSDLHGRAVVRLPYRPAPADAGPIRRLLNPMTCARSWMDVLHAIVGLPLALVGFVLAVLWWSLALGGLLYPLWGWSLHLIPGYTDVGSHLLPDNPALATLVVYMIGGALFALTLPMALRVLAGINSALARMLLLAPEEISARVLTTGNTIVPTPEVPDRERHYVSLR